QQFGIRRQWLIDAESKRSCKGLRIVEGHFQFQVSEVTAPEAFSNPKGLRLRMPANVEPPAVVEACGLDHQCVLFPVPNRVPQPGGIGILRKLPAIGEDGSMRTVGRLIEDHDQTGGLHDPGETAEIEERDADRQTARERAVLPEVLYALQAQSSCPGLNVLWLQVL